MASFWRLEGWGEKGGKIFQNFFERCFYCMTYFFTRITIKEQWQYKIYKFKVLCKFLSYFCFCCLNHVVSNKTEPDAPILWPPDVKNWLIWKYPDAGKDRRREEKGMTEDEMVGWHHWLNGHRNLSKLWELVMDREAWHAAIHGVTKSWERLCDWTELNWSNKTENK